MRYAFAVAASAGYIVLLEAQSAMAGPTGGNLMGMAVTAITAMRIAREGYVHRSEYREAMAHAGPQDDANHMRPYLRTVFAGYALVTVGLGLGAFANAAMHGDSQKQWDSGLLALGMAGASAVALRQAAVYGMAMRLAPKPIKLKT